MNKSNPIGVFDSGYGGLTILKSIKKSLPDYDYLYLGDNARAPYGDRSFELVYQYTLDAVKFLFNQGCSLVIVACNTSSAKALRSIQQKDLEKLSPNKRVLGVIRPCIEEIAENKEINSVGIIGTLGTISSNSYGLEIEKYAPKVNYVQHACPLWVPLIENEKQESNSGKEIIKNDLSILLQKSPKIDTLVLACTHYPILNPILRSFLPKSIAVMSQGPIVAKKLVEYLNKHPEIDEACSKNSTTLFMTSEKETVFNQVAGKIMNSSINAKSVSF